MVKIEIDYVMKRRQESINASLIIPVEDVNGQILESMLYLQPTSFKQLPYPLNIVIDGICQLQGCKLLSAEIVGVTKE